MDLRGSIPSFIKITDGKVHDINILDDLIPEFFQMLTQQKTIQKSYDA
ncbi:MAG: Transposase [Candidatus Brocadiaceae bacterium]|nr:Transposase [Candidatus Brocadiaceae bacterium]